MTYFQEHPPRRWRDVGTDKPSPVLRVTMEGDQINYLIDPSGSPASSWPGWRCAHVVGRWTRKLSALEDHGPLYDGRSRLCITFMSDGSLDAGPGAGALASVLLGCVSPLAAPLNKIRDFKEV